MTLSNFQIEYLCEYLKVNLIVCILQDDLEMIDEIHDGGYVINYGTEKNGGTHWVCFYKRDDNVFHFDSFGAIYSTDVKKYISSVKNKGFNQWIVQDINDDHCGFYCVAFLHYIQNYDGYFFNGCNDFINYFKDDTTKNLGILKIMFKRLIKQKDLYKFDKVIYDKIK